MVLLASDVAFGLTTTPTANLVSPQYEFNGPGIIIFAATCTTSAGRFSIDVNGKYLAKPSATIPYVYATSLFRKKDHEIFTQAVPAGRITFTMVASTGVPTVDYTLEWIPA